MAISNTQRDRLISNLRSYLSGLARRRSSGKVTADDAQSYLTRQGIRERMVRTRVSLINAAFSSDSFESVGSVPSNRPAAKGRQITEWTIA